MSKELPDQAQLFDDCLYSTRCRIVVGVSGGSDSLSLLFLLHEYLAERGCADALLAVTVDHALRPESFDEARYVSELCASHSIHHQIVTWSEAKPETGLSAASRDARYDLLCKAARDVGSDLLLVAHNADDQAETIAMRQLRGSGIGLSGMAPVSLIDGTIWLLRPLLGVSRASLRAYLRARDILWVDDPSNENEHYERVRIRKALNAETRINLLQLGAQSATQRQMLSDEAARLIRSHARYVGQGVELDCPALLHGEAGLYGLKYLLMVLGQRDHPASQIQMAALAQGLVQVNTSWTLSGCIISRSKAGFRVERERRGGISGQDSKSAQGFSGQPLRKLVSGHDLSLVREITHLLGALPIPSLFGEECGILS